MRIVFMTMFEPDQGGGCSRVAHELAQQFALQHDTAIICGADKTGIAYKGPLVMLGIESVGKGQGRMPLLSTTNVGIIVDFLNAFRPEVIHAHDPVLLAQMGQIWAQTHNIPFVYTAHILSKSALSFGMSELNRALDTHLAETVVQRFLKDYYRNCDGIIALNDAALSDLSAFAGHGRIHVIPNGRFLADYADCPLPSLAAPTKLLTFVGFISDRKNQVYLLEVLSHLSADYHLQLVGDTLTESYGRGFRQRIRELGLTERVHLTGPVPPERIRDYLAPSHLFVSASKAEVQSLAVIEALASGTPVVGLGNETVDELVDVSVGRRLAPDAPPQAFAMAVRELCEMEPSSYQALCHRARARVQHLDWAKVMERTAALYQELAQAKRTGPQLKRAPHLLPGLEGRLPYKLEQRLAQREQKSYQQAARVVRTARLPWAIAGLGMLVSIVAQVLANAAAHRRSGR